jgi:hypothetical protein
VQAQVDLVQTPLFAFAHVHGGGFTWRAGVASSDGCLKPLHLVRYVSDMQFQ